MLQRALLPIGCMAMCFGVTGIAQPIDKAVRLPGVAVDPPTNPSGDARAHVILDTSTSQLSVYLDFQGFNTATQSVKLHCCVDSPGFAMPATKAFTDPDIGNTDGILQMTYKTSDRNTWSSDFLGGGSAADAESKFAQGLRDKKVYVVIYTVNNPELSNYKGGEMRAFFP
jgi:CHRD domain